MHKLKTNKIVIYDERIRTPIKKSHDFLQCGFYFVLKC